MGAAFFVISGIIFIKHKHIPAPIILISGGFFLSAFLLPAVLKPVYIFWMKLAFVLSWINTRLILIIMFYLVFTPIGLIIKLLKVDLLDKKIDKKKDSYWLKKEKVVFNPLNYERQF